MTKPFSLHSTCVLLLCAGVAACGGAPKKSNVMDMYDVPNPASGHPVNVDYDSYYTQPTTYKGCAVINDAPSCGGG